MEPRTARHGPLSAGTKRLVLVLTLLALVALPATALAGQPVHSVRGHGFLAPLPGEYIDQITIDATMDENGDVEGTIFYTVSYHAPEYTPPDYRGNLWKIEVSALAVQGNVATIDGNVAFDQRNPENVGCPVRFVVTDNGSRSSDPDMLQLVDLGGECVFDGEVPVGGNFTVR